MLGLVEERSLAIPYAARHRRVVRTTVKIGAEPERRVCRLAELRATDLRILAGLGKDRPA